MLTKRSDVRRSGGTSESATATLLPSSVQDLRIPWGQVSGYILYTDLARTEWQTHFRYRMELSNTPWVDVVWVGKTSELGEPDYTLEEGWRNRPDHLKPVAPVAPTSGAGTD